MTLKPVGQVRPPQMKQAVVSKRLAGESKRQIARDVEIHRDTVDNALDESQVEASLAQWRRDYLQLVPKALGVVKRMLDDAQEKSGRARRPGGKLSPDLTHASDEELNISMAELMAAPQPAGKGLGSESVCKDGMMDSKESGKGLSSVMMQELERIKAGYARIRRSPRNSCGTRMPGSRSGSTAI